MERNRKEIILLGFILLLAAILRFYRLRDYLVFLGDEGRDVLVVKRMLVDLDLTMLGPITSVGGMYLGPIYYYFMAPFLWLFGYDPVGPAVMIAFLGVAAVFLVYYLCRQFLNKRAALFASFFFATSPWVIRYSRSSWNPNALPFFSLLLIFSLLKVYVKKDLKYIFWAGLAFGISIQLHYIALFFAVIFMIFFFLIRKSLSIRTLGLFFSGFLSVFWPFIVFELRHNFPNTQTILKFIFKRGEQGGLNFSLKNFFSDAFSVGIRMFDVLVMVDKPFWAKILFFSVLLFFLFRWFRFKEKKKTFLILLLWLLVSISAYGLYQGAIYEYYFVPVFALPFILTAYFLAYFYKKYKKRLWVRMGVVFLSFFIFFQHMRNLPQRILPNRLVDQTERIARFVLQKTDYKPYNFALMSTGNSDHAYRYFLELWGYPPVVLENEAKDPERKTATDQLLIVCEQRKCQPLGYSLWEIAGFGRAEVSGVWEVFPVKVIKLKHYEKS